MEKRRLKAENRAYYQTKLESLVSARTEMLRQALTELERSCGITLEALGDALNLKDAETEVHSRRVTAFTLAIARAMGLPPDAVRVIARGAFLHDVGMIAIPDAILRKPGRLSPEERAIMQQHALLGYQMLRKIRFLHEAADIVHSHQERFDGSGYPRGLKGDQIPLGARIIAIADSFDAMTSDRPYRAAQSIPSGKREIERQSGRQFDPEIVKVFLSISEQIWHELRSEIEAQSRVEQKPSLGRERRMAALEVNDWEPALTLPLPPQPSLELLEVARQDILTFLDWVSHDVAQVDPDGAKHQIQRAAARLIEIAAATPAALSDAIEADVNRPRAEANAERLRQIEEDAEHQQ